MRIKNFKKQFFIIIISVILTVGGIKAVDKSLFLASISVTKKINRCPQEMVFVDTDKGGFCIDKYEDSPSSDCPFLNPKNQSQTMANLNNISCKPVSKKGKFPWTNISKDQAEIACRKAGKRLPTNKEWYLASLGTPDGKTSNWQENDCQVNSNWSSQPGLTGSGKNCFSSAGAYDMIGNVWEWVSGSVKDGVFDGRNLPEQGYIQEVDDQGLSILTDPSRPNQNYNRDHFWILKKGLRVIARGGYWNTGSDAGIYSAYLLSLSSQASPGAGFRCVREPNY